MADICVHCGNTAIAYNSEGQPACGRCREKKPKMYRCSKCKDIMVAKKGKYGSFWGCMGFPMCNNTVSLKKALIKERLHK